MLSYDPVLRPVSKFYNVHSSGGCSGGYSDRPSAIATLNGYPIDHPEGPVVARIRVSFRPAVQVFLPATYVEDAIERAVLERDWLRVIETRDERAWRYSIYLNQKALTALMEDAHQRSFGAASRHHRASARRAHKALKTMEAYLVTS